MIKRFFILSSLCMVLGVSAQQSHTVVKGDNPYNIARKYGITVDELLKLNPKFKDGKLTIGDVLTVKSDKSNTTASVTKVAITEKAKPNAQFGKIVLQPKQTIYGITKQYRISETDLRKLNPELDSHRKIGDEITLPFESIKKYGGNQQPVVATKPVETVVNTPTTNAVADEDSYTVQAKDNYYRITKQLGITQQELYALNPGLEEKGLKPGEVIRVKKSNGNTVNAVTEPVNPKTKIDSGNEKSSTNPTNTNTDLADEYVTYTVQQGDTVFSIVNKYGISIDELIALNPDLSHGLKTGMVLKIKKLDPAYIKKSGDALSVVLMLPFGYSTNETQYRTMAIDFLTGAKLAIERNARGGQKLDIKIVDSGNEASFRNSLTQINPNNTDLIIGPFFKSNVIDVLDFTKTQKIPIVAPFANSPELYNYSNLVIVETNDQTYADKIVDEVKTIYSDQKIYIVADGKKDNANYIKAGLEKAVKNPNVTIVSSPAEIKSDQNMMTGQSAPVIAILASDNDSTGEAFSNRIIALTKEVQGMKAFSMFYVPSFEKKVDDLSQANLVYLMDRKINTDGSFEKEILAAYKSKYCKTPPRYAIIGFDVMNDMLTRENKKGEIFKQMTKVQTQLATKFEFVKSKANGAYVNTGYRVIRLVP